MPKKIKKIIKKKRQKAVVDITQSSEGEKLGTSEFSVTYDPIKDFDPVPVKIQEELERLYHLVHRNPQNAIAPLKALIEKYHDKRAYNYLSLAYLKLERFDDAKKIVYESYEKHPEYLFAKINYAELCLQEGKIEEIPDIFDNKFDLKMLFPERTVFHISEVLSFYSFTGVYYIKTGKLDAAILCLELIKRIELNHDYSLHMLAHLVDADLTPEQRKKLLEITRK